VLRHLENRLRENGLTSDSLEDDFDLIESGVVDSFAFVELVVGVSEDLNLELDFADLADEPFSTFGELVNAFERIAARYP